MFVKLLVFVILKVPGSHPLATRQHKTTSLGRLPDSQICQATSAVLVLDMHWCSQASKLSHDLNGHPATQCSGLLHGVSRENNCPGRWLIHFPWNKYEHTIWTRRIWTHVNLSKHTVWIDMNKKKNWLHLSALQLSFHSARCWRLFHFQERYIQYVYNTHIIYIIIYTYIYIIIYMYINSH